MFSRTNLDWIKTEKCDSRRKRSLSEHRGYVRSSKKNLVLDHINSVEWYKKKSKLFSDDILPKVQSQSTKTSISVEKIWNYYFKLVSKAFKLENEANKIKNRQ